MWVVRYLHNVFPPHVRNSFAAVLCLKKIHIVQLILGSQSKTLLAKYYPVGLTLGVAYGVRQLRFSWESQLCRGSGHSAGSGRLERPFTL